MFKKNVIPLQVSVMFRWEKYHSYISDIYAQIGSMIALKLWF